MTIKYSNTPTQQVLQETFQVVASNKGMALFNPNPLSSHSLKTTCVRKHFLLIFFFFLLNPHWYFSIEKPRSSSDSVVKETHLWVPIRGFKLRGLLQSLSWESLSVTQYTEGRKVSPNYLALSTRHLCFLLHTFSGSSISLNPLLTI